MSKFVAKFFKRIEKRDCYMMMMMNFVTSGSVRHKITEIVFYEGRLKTSAHTLVPGYFEHNTA